MIIWIFLMFISISIGLWSYIPGLHSKKKVESCGFRNLSHDYNEGYEVTHIYCKPCCDHLETQVDKDFAIANVVKILF